MCSTPLTHHSVSQRSKIPVHLELQASRIRQLTDWFCDSRESVNCQGIADTTIAGWLCDSREPVNCQNTADTTVADSSCDSSESPNCHGIPETTIPRLSVNPPTTHTPTAPSQADVPLNIWLKSLSPNTKHILTSSYRLAYPPV